MLTIAFAVPGVLVLAALAAAPLFQLWDDRASERGTRVTGRPAVVAVPEPRRASDRLRPVPVVH